ncbi:protoheme IX farnesyltransferase [Corallococcus praedator]|uniref:Protoheme IX farnesyltransferase n=1 Tax=Corallococcus praedator TaxID=2316724 RepID=A0ABX9Q833_9BACT|nr:MULTISPECIES: heme o synthase [Corallococcus]RKH00062.1 protoheme IX farnesyltransferase [Corallococcus sp. CA047B]RKH19414.1 protoheme IX farnesyltransferase [Corallococcus sp. CA031C]RKH92293.1 protoheme IX farnesyltransferase [Corallococcus praedator]
MSARALPQSSTASDLISLTKPSLSSLVLITAAGGMFLAPGPLGPVRALVTLLATAGTVGAANAFNCYMERHSDQFMARTRNRPLPAGRMDPSTALWFGLSLAVVSLPALVLGANLLTGVLGLIALLSYVLAYTPLKARTSAAMLVGAVPGALPPLMGWTAVTGTVDAGGFALFAIMFLWQMPHFIAIALFRKEEYAAAGLKSVPIERGDESSRAQVVLYLVALVPMTLLPFQLHIAGTWYLAAAVVLGLSFLGMGAWGFFKHLGKPWARQTFLFSLVYLTGLFAAMTLDRVPHG